MSAQGLPAFVADLSWRIAVAWIVGAVLCWLLRKRSAQWRHAVWLGVLLVPLAPPVAAGARGLGPWVAGFVRAAGAEVAGSARDDAHGASLGVAAKSRPAALEAEAGATSTGSPDGGTAGATETASISWRAAAFASWMLGAVVLAARAVRRGRRLLRVAAAAMPAPDGLRELARSVAARLRVRAPDVRVAAGLASPGLAGGRRPVLLVPRELVDSSEPLAARELVPIFAPILTHELLHLRRHDRAWSALATAVRALFWFHPCVVHAAAALARERELAVDEAVVREGAISPEEYAMSLLQVAQHVTGAVRRPPALHPALALSSSARCLRARIERLVRAGVPTRVPPPRWLAAACTLALVACGAASSTQEGARGTCPTCGQAVSTPIDRAERPGAVEPRARLNGYDLQSPRVDSRGLDPRAGGNFWRICVLKDGTILPPIQDGIEDDGRGFRHPVAVRVPSAAERARERHHEISIRPGATAAEYRAVLAGGGAPLRSPDELVAALLQSMKEHPGPHSATVYAFGKSTFGSLAPWLAALSTELPELTCSYAGVPADMGEAAQIHDTLARIPFRPGLGEVLLQVDARAPSSSVAHVMQELAARGESRIAFLAVGPGGAGAKFSLYLPTDEGLASGR